MKQLRGYSAGAGRGRTGKLVAICAASFALACSAGGGAPTGALESGQSGSSFTMGGGSDPFLIAGPEGGPFPDGSRTYTLENDSPTRTITWEVQATTPWLRFTPESGLLGPGSSTEVLAELDQEIAAELAVGEYPSDIVFRSAQKEDGSIYLAFLLRVRPAGDDGDDGDGDGGSGDGRITEGLLALYDFEELGGTTIYDRSEVEPALDLTVEDETRVSWTAGAISIDQPTRLSTSGAATKLIEGCKQSNEVTLEVWISPDNLIQDGPARLLTVSAGATLRNCTLGQGLWDEQPSDSFNCRLRTTETDLDGMPMLTTDANAAHMGLTHVVYTRGGDSVADIYVDGQAVAQTSVGGDFSNWSDDYRLALANEIGADRPWLGRLHLAAVYDRALDAGEVYRNYIAGTGDAQHGDLEVTPSASFDSGGVPGGPFTPEEKTYTLSNVGQEALQYEASVDVDWVTLSNGNGKLWPGDSQELTVALDTDQVRTFSEGVYTGTLTVRNAETGLGSTSRSIRLDVNEEGGGGGGDSDWTWESSVTRGGITWYFDTEYKVGAFVNGDYWVVGPVGIESIDPPSIQLGSRVVNGSMLDPEPAKAHGYDSTLFGSWAGSHYDEGLNVARGISSSDPLIVGPGNSLVSTISPEETAYSPPGLEYAAVLTVLDSPPPEGSFRPAYTGTSKRIYNLSELQLDRLGSLPVVSGMPSTQAMSDDLDEVWLDHVPGWLGRFLHPAQNMPDYGRDISVEIGKASLLLHLDLPYDSKYPLLVRFVQLGIDLDGLFQNGQSWSPDGGHTVGRKWPIIFKRAMFSEQTNLQTDASRFSEDGQTFYVLETSPGVYNYGYGGYGPGQDRMPDWGEKYWTQTPVGSDGFFLWNESNYRSCCTFNSSAGHFLSAMIMGLRGSWDWEPAFDYMDRYMQLETGWHRQMDSWTGDVWDTYRPDYPGYDPIPGSWWPPGL